MPGKGRQKKQGRARKGTGSVRQVPGRPGYYAAEIGLGTDANGKRIRKTVTGRSPEEVETKLDAIREDTRDGRPVITKKPTVTQHFDAFLREKARSKERNTMSKYANHYKNHIRPALGRLKLTELDYNRINAFFHLLATKTRKDGSPALSPTTQTDIARVLSMRLNDAVRKGLLRSNPVHQVEGPQYEDKEAGI